MLYRMDIAIVQLRDDKTYCAHESIILEKWKTEKTYETVRASAKSFSETFKFVDGPPFVSGTLHLGHLLIGGLKDAVLKHQYKSGKESTNRLGYDCHGLPSESLVQKQLNVTTKADIEAIGLAKFNKVCKDTVNSLANSWEPIYDSIGRWADFTNTYKTMDLPFMESVWWCFSQFWKKGLVFRGSKVMPYSFSCMTPLSNFEAGQNYKDIKTETIYVSFPLKDDANRSLVAWTTTPWTLVANVALCVNPDLLYVLCTDSDGKEYIVGEPSVANLKKEFVSVVPFKKGSEMVGMEYVPLFTNLDFKYHKVLADTYVKNSSDIGTCIVHLAPAFGEDDYNVCAAAGIVDYKMIDSLCPIDESGKYTSIMGDLSGMLVFDASKKIIKDLRTRGHIARQQTYEHSYPHCYRSDTPLIYRATSSFFIDVPEIKDRMMELNATINWCPPEVGSNRFHNWLKDAKPWCVARNRYFGTGIAVWESEDEEEMMCIGSVDELMEHAVNLTERPTDIHPEFINDIILKSPTSGKLLKRVPFVFDCWFESGCVPYAQIHYPFENKELIDDCGDYLCDFIAEGLDQCRGWYYTLMVLSTVISNKPPAKIIMCTGLILDETGLKFSKKYGNFVDPSELITKYGADVLRLYLLSSPVIHAEPLLFSEKEVLKVKQRIIPYVNSVKFFIEHYINFTRTHDPSLVQYLETNQDDLNIMDQWILERCTQLKSSVIRHMDNYTVDKACQQLIDFVEDLTNWYVKFNRDRLKGLCGVDDWKTSLSVLFTVLIDYVVFSSSFMPFLSEHLFTHLKHIDPTRFTYDSVHLMAYPTSHHDYHISEVFERLQNLTRMIRSLRDSSPSHTSVKTPIKQCTVYHHTQTYLDSIKPLITLIQDEVNVIDFVFEVLNDSQNCFVGKPNNKSIGTKFRKNAGTVRTFIETLTQDQLKWFHDEVLSGTSPTFTIPDVGDVTTDELSVSVERKVETNPSIKYLQGENTMISADMTYDIVTHNLYQARLFTVMIQNTRKEMMLRPWNKINVFVSGENAKEIEKMNTYFVGRLGTPVCATDESYEKTYDWELFDGTIVKIGYVVCVV